MALDTGTRIGPYEVVSRLGEGGMGEVYRARDTKLKRDVALKVLPEHFTSDPDRLARFQREAEVLATLNHPHIAHIHGLEDTGSVRALVMELVDGEDLAARLTRGPIPLDEVLPIARQIAEALEAAHEQGIVHRDLKPANIKVRSDGTVKVLDFGLAKAMEPGTPGGVSVTGPGLAALANSPTITSPALTLHGMLLGTAAYMSPEQAKGRPADKRSDVWAFGCVLYEMLSGRRAFDGDDVSDTLANVLKIAPDWSRLPPETPPSVARLLRRSLMKDRRQRLADMADARLELDASADEAVAAGRPSKTRSTGQVWRERVFWAAAVIAGIVAATVKPLQPPGGAAPELRFDIVTPPSVEAQDVSVAISPDGQSIAFIADHEKRGKLWVRSLRSGAVRPLTGTEGARFPFWSSDNRSLGFFALANLKTVDVETSAVTSLAPVIGGGGGGAWHGDTIVYSPNSGAGPLYRVNPKGGAPVQVTKLESDRAVAHRHPTFLPDGRHFLFLEVTTNQVFVGDLEGGPQIPLLTADAGPLYSGSGHLLFVRQGTLLAQPFDPDSRVMRGAAVPVVEQVAIGEVLRAAVSASASGAVIYRTGIAPPRRQFIWVDRTGSERRRIATPEVSQANPDLSPDGSRLVLQRNIGGNTDLWFLALGRGAWTRFTNDDSIEAIPVWSPDGDRVAFTSNRAVNADTPEAPIRVQPGTSNLWVMATDGGQPAKLVVASPSAKWLSDWSPDGRSILYRSLDQQAGTHDTWVVNLDGSSPVRILGGRADERDAQFSPDGRWIAFQSDESGRYEIYIQRFPGPGGKERISTAGGTQVRWRKDGRELFYITPDNELAAVTISLPADAGTPAIDPAQILFTTQMVPGGIGIARQQYVVAPDGQQFLINTREVTGDHAPPITLLLNWRGPRP